MPSIKLYYLSALLLCIFIYRPVGAQGSDGIMADEMFAGGNYIQALDEYLKLEKKINDDPELKHRIGTCYLNINNDKTKALPYLEYCFKSGQFRNDLLLELGKAYQYAYKFSEAENYYNKYRAKASSKEYPLIDHYIETCENAKEVMKKPVNVTFENLGKEINSNGAEYYPFVTADQSTLYFTARREENTGKMRGFNGYYTSDVYSSTVKTGAWTKAKKMVPTVNTAQDEQCVGISPDGKNIIIYMENLENPGDLIHAEYSKAKTFGRPVPFNPPINSDKSEFEGCYGSNSDIIYFTSNRKGGVGESDIYVSRRLPTGEWGIPKNLGPNINTIYKESFPVVSEDGKTLYFSSQGHTNMGGYDIFKSKWNEAAQNWETPVNIGYPINTTDDDMMFSLSGNGRDGYISAVRKEGFGDLDIYKIIFNDAEKPLTVIVGKVLSPDSTKKKIVARIIITDLKTNDILDDKNVNNLTGKYIFIVEPGKYKVEIESKGYSNITEDVMIYDKSDFVSVFHKNFILVTEGAKKPEEAKVTPDPKTKNK